MLKAIKETFSNDLSIDLGTANTLIYVKSHGVILNEPSVIAVQQNSTSNNPDKIVAVGAKAKEMLGKNPESITVIRPLKDGVIADFTATEKMLQYFITKHKRKIFQINPRVLICVPVGSTQVERRAIKESALEAGVREVFLIEEPMAAALGAGMPIHEASGSMVIDIGGGTTEIAIISLGGIVYSSSIRIGGDKFDDSIVNYLRRKHGTLIGEATAEKIKHQIGNAYLTKETYEMKIRGINLAAGIPHSITVNNHEILKALQEPLSCIIEAVRMALENSPPELSSDIAEHGIVLTGGGCLLKDLDKLIQNETGLSVTLADNPLTCVVKGGGMALEAQEFKMDIFC